MHSWDSGMGSGVCCVALRCVVMCVLQVSAMCCDAFRNLFHQDKVGVASLAAVRVISGLVKSLNYNMKPEVRLDNRGRV